MNFSSHPCVWYAPCFSVSCFFIPFSKSLDMAFLCLECLKYSLLHTVRDDWLKPASLVILCPLPFPTTCTITFSPVLSNISSKILPSQCVPNSRGLCFPVWVLTVSWTRNNLNRTFDFQGIWNWYLRKIFFPLYVCPKRNSKTYRMFFGKANQEEVIQEGKRIRQEKTRKYETPLDERQRKREREKGKKSQKDKHLIPASRLQETCLWCHMALCFQYCHFVLCLFKWVWIA